jgi:hypothetical protein
MGGKMMRLKIAAIFLSALLLNIAVGTARADNQTPTTSPIVVGSGDLPYEIRLRRVDTHRTLPTLQSFASGIFAAALSNTGLWVIVGGRTNGLHNFSSDPLENFPPSAQNRRIWVIDPARWRVWSRSIKDSHLSVDQIDQLSATAYEHVQFGDALYVVGGYGYSHTAKDFKTFPVLTAFDLPKIIDWVQNPAGSPDLADLIRQTSDETLRITGGQMTIIGDRAILAFGQDFDGGYGSPTAKQTYSGQVRSFRILDNGKDVSIADIRGDPETPDLVNYRRRDLPMVSVIDTTEGQPENEAVALAGVFTETNGIFTVPVEINGAGEPTQADPTLRSTFKQGMNGYDCATIGLYSKTAKATHSVLFGGISYIYYKQGQFVEDTNFPFINQTTTIVRDRNGHYRQYLLDAEFPRIVSPDGKRYLFGAEAVVFRNLGIPTIGNGLVDLDALRKAAPNAKSHVLGRIFGGIAAEKPNFGRSVASNEVFDIVLQWK